MIQVIFDQMFSWDDLNLFLTDVNIVPPAPKRMSVNVPFSNGLLDIIMKKGNKPKTWYSNKQITLTFAMKNYDHDWEEIFADLRNKLHGKYMHVVIDEKTDYYNDAYVTVTSTKAEGNMGTVVIALDCKPYELKTRETIYLATAKGTGSWITVQCRNAGTMDVIPEFHSTGTITVQYNNKNYTFDGSGEHESADIEFMPGMNTIKISGASGTKITIHYREGRL